MNFEDWMNEKEGYVQRADRIYGETVSNAPKDAVDHWKLIEKWIKTAYICGKIDGSEYSQDIIKHLQQENFLLKAK